jgi:hypothetical protein
MPAVTQNFYDQFRLNMFNGGAIDFTTPGGNGIKCAIVTASYTPDQNLHDFWNDVSANEVSGTGYTAGGNVMSGGSAAVNGSGLVTVDIGDPATWTQNGAGFSNGRRAIVYLDTGTAGTSALISYSNDFGSDQGNLNGDFSVTVNASGLFTSAR